MRAVTASRCRTQHSLLPGLSLVTAWDRVVNEKA